MTETAVFTEVSTQHDFFTDWFSGNVPQDDHLFNQAVGNRLVPGFVNIQPAGVMLMRDDLMQQIREGYGKNPAFRIRVGNLQVHHQLPQSTILATYEEYQRGAQNSAPDNARLSTVLLRIADGGFKWLWVHETWLPKEQFTAGTFDF